MYYDFIVASVNAFDWRIRSDHITSRWLITRPAILGCLYFIKRGLFAVNVGFVAHHGGSFWRPWQRMATHRRGSDAPV